MRAELVRGRVINDELLVVLSETPSGDNCGDCFHVSRIHVLGIVHWIGVSRGYMRWELCLQDQSL